MRRSAILLVAILPLAGCATAVPAITGLVTAGVVAGIAFDYSVDQGMEWAGRRIHNNVQNAVAEAAGPLAVGQSAPWNVDKLLPLSDKSGTVEVARIFGDTIPCKDVIFTLDGDEAHSIYTTTICRNDKGDWRWALAEPSIDRWGSLQ